MISKPNSKNELKIFHFCISWITTVVFVINGFNLYAQPVPSIYAPSAYIFASPINESRGIATVRYSQGYYVTGWFKGAVNFSDSRSPNVPVPASTAAPLPLTSSGGGQNQDGYLAKYASDGELLWVRNIQSGSNAGNISGMDIAVLGSGDDNVIMTGYFENSIKIGSTSISVNSFGSRDIFVQKFLSNGTRDYGFVIGSSSDDDVYGIVYGSSKVYLCGSFSDAMSYKDENNTTGSALSSLSAVVGDKDIFVCGYDFSGPAGTNNPLGISAGGTGPDEAYDIAYSNNSLYVTGYFTASGGAHFGASEGTGFNPDVGKDVFVSKCTTSPLDWLHTFSAGGLNDDYGKAIVADANDNVYVAGYYQGFYDNSSASATFYSFYFPFRTATNLFLSPHNTTNYVNASANYDGFVLKYDFSGCTDVSHPPTCPKADFIEGANDDKILGICYGNSSVMVVGESYSWGYGSSISFPPTTLILSEYQICFYTLTNQFPLTSTGGKFAFIQKYNENLISTCRDFRWSTHDMSYSSVTNNPSSSSSAAIATGFINGDFQSTNYWTNFSTWYTSNSLSFSSNGTDASIVFHYGDCLPPCAPPPSATGISSSFSMFPLTPYVPDVPHVSNGDIDRLPNDPDPHNVPSHPTYYTNGGDDFEQLHLPCDLCIRTFELHPGQKYLISAWVKQKNPCPTTTARVWSHEPYCQAQIMLRYPLTTSPYTVLTPSGKIIDGWQRIQGAFVIPANASCVEVDLMNLAESTSEEVYYDDIKIQPFNSSMKAYVYDPVSLRLVSELDENHYATFYEYDEEGKLTRVKKETSRGIVTVKESRTNTKKN